ncbi:MAG: glycine betaine ABC transporter substrate-binding protein [Chloroflexota bacterium]
MIATFFLFGCRNDVPTEVIEQPSQPFLVVTPQATPVGATTVAPTVVGPTVVGPTVVGPTAVSPTAAPSLSPTIAPTPTPATELLSSPTPTQSPRTLTIGSTTDTEQLILSQMLVLLLQNNEYTVIDRTGLGGTTAVRAALENNEIDLAIERTSNTLAVVHNLPTTALPSNANRAHQLAQSLDAPRNLTWLDRLAFDNHFILVVDQETAAAGLVTLSDLARFANEKGEALRFCLDAEFYARGQDGLSGLQTHYSFVLKDSSIIIMGSNQLFAELRAGNCDIAVGFSTDGHIVAWDLHPLEDDLGFFPTNTAAPVIRTPVLETHPDLAELLNRLGVRLSEDVMRQLNARVDLGGDGQAQSGDEETAVSVAQSFLEKTGLLGDTPQIVVGSTDDTLNTLLATMSLLLLNETPHDVAPLSSLATAYDGYLQLQRNAVDLIWEYSGVALRDFYRVPETEFPTTNRLIYDEAARRGAEDGLLWLERSTVGQQTAVFVHTDAFTPTPGTLPDLAILISKAETPPKLCVQPTFYHDPAGLVALFDAYGFSLPNSAILFVDETNDLYANVGQEVCQIGIGDKLNGRLGQWSLETLADPLGFFTRDSLTPILRQTTAYTYPEIDERLSALTAVLDHPSVNQMLARVELGPDGQPETGDEEALPTVAELYLCEMGLLSNCRLPTAETASTCRNVIVNGDFEQATGWVLGNSEAETAVSATYTSEQVHQGIRAGQLGSQSRDAQPSISTLSQLVTLPENTTSATLTYWIYPASQDFVGGDVQTIAIYDPSFTAVQEQLFQDISNEQAWVRQNHDLTAYGGQTVGLSFGVINDGDSIPTVMLIDDVVLEICE